MTVTSQQLSESYVGDGSTVSFVVPYYFLLGSDIVVSVDETVKTLGTDYSVSGDGNPAGGAALFVTAPINGAIVTLLRKPPVTQLVAIENNETVLEEVLTDIADKLTMIAQYYSTRALLLSDSDPTTSFVLPTKSARENGTLTFDANGDPTIGPIFDETVLDGIVSTATTAAAEASASATSAAASAAAAEEAASGVTIPGFAATSDAQAGTSTTVIMSPARVKDAFNGMAFATPIAGGAATTLNNRFSRVFDLKAMGTPNNGTDDDYPTFAAAYTAAKAAGGGCILLPHGPMRFNTTPNIDMSQLAIVGAGAGATRWLNGSDSQTYIRLTGADVHSIEIGHMQFQTASGNPSTGGGVFSFERNSNSSSGAGCFDVKLHHFTTFNAYHAVTTAYSAEGGSTVFLDIAVSDFELRNMQQVGFYLTMAAGPKIDRGAISFASPQTSQPAAGSSGFYLGDWLDGWWINNINALGGECCLDMGSDWSSGGRKPGQGQFFGLSCDSGWLAATRLRACAMVDFFGLINGNLANASGNPPGLLINGAGSSFNSTAGVDTVSFIGGEDASCYGAGTQLIGNAQNVFFRGRRFISNGQGSNTGGYNNAYVGPNVNKFAFDGCVFDNNSWFSTTKAGYGLFIDSNCNHFQAINNQFNAANHVTGGFFNGSSGASDSDINNNLT